MLIKQIASGIKTIPSALMPNSDTLALILLRSELQKSMPKSEVDEWVIFIKKLCKKLNIKPSALPINSKHSGNLSSETNELITKSIIKYVTQ
jgi:hypothetical protein